VLGCGRLVGLLASGLVRVFSKFRAGCRRAGRDSAAGHPFACLAWSDATAVGGVNQSGDLASVRRGQTYAGPRADRVRVAHAERP
jgi:hypothetical protein